MARLLVDEEGLKAATQKMARACLLLNHWLHAPRSHCVRPRGGFGCFDHRMKMIGHDGPGGDEAPVTTAGLAEVFEKRASRSRSERKMILRSLPRKVMSVRGAGKVEPKLLCEPQGRRAVWADSNRNLLGVGSFDSIASLRRHIS